MIKEREFRLYYDEVFKEIFTSAPEALILFISDILNIDYNEIKKEFNLKREVELNKGRINNKKSRCDLIAKLNNNKTIINIEVNSHYYSWLYNRNITHLARITNNYIKQGVKYKMLLDYEIIQININAFSSKIKEAIEEFSFLGKKSCKELSDLMKIYNFDIVKCYKIYYNKDVFNKISNERKKRIIVWGALLYAKDIKEIYKILEGLEMSKETKKKLKNVMEMFAKSEELISDEEYQWFKECEIEGIKYDARNEGIQEGEIRGIKLGETRGIKLGETKGKSEENTRIAKNMLNLNLPLDVISKATDLSEAKLMEIKNL